MSDRAQEAGEGMTPEEIDNYIFDAVERFQRANVERGQNAFPISVLVRGLVSRTGLSEDEIVARFMEMGIRLAPEAESATARKPLRTVTENDISRFLRKLEEGSDKSNEPLKVRL